MSSQRSSRDGQLIKDNLDGTFDFHTRVSCSSGTYVRTLAEDFGKRLYVGAHLAELRRTRVGDFSIDQAITLDQLKIHFGEESIGAVLVPLGAALSRLPFVHLTAEDVSRANHGREVMVAEPNWADGENVRMCDGVATDCRWSVRRQHKELASTCSARGRIKTPGVCKNKH